MQGGDGRETSGGETPYNPHRRLPAFWEAGDAKPHLDQGSAGMSLRLPTEAQRHRGNAEFQGFDSFQIFFRFMLG